MSNKLKSMSLFQKSLQNFVLLDNNNETDRDAEIQEVICRSFRECENLKSRIALAKKLCNFVIAKKSLLLINVVADSLFNIFRDEVDQIMEKKTVDSISLLKTTIINLFVFLQSSYSISFKDYSKDEVASFVDVLAAVFSLIIDLTLIENQSCFDNKECRCIGSQLAETGIIFLENHQDKLLDSILQSSATDLDFPNYVLILLPLLKYILLRQSWSDQMNEVTYVKFVATSKKAISLLKPRKARLSESIRVSALKTAAPSKFFEWISMRKEGAKLFEDTPICDNTSSIDVTKWLINECDMQFIENLLDISLAEVEVESLENDVSFIDETNSLQQKPSGELFVLDTKPKRATVESISSSMKETENYLSDDEMEEGSDDELLRQTNYLLGSEPDFAQEEDVAVKSDDRIDEDTAKTRKSESASASTIESVSKQKPVKIKKKKTDFVQKKGKAIKSDAQVTKVTAKTSKSEVSHADKIKNVSSKSNFDKVKKKKKKKTDLAQEKDEIIILEDEMGETAAKTFTTELSDAGDTENASTKQKPNIVKKIKKKKTDCTPRENGETVKSKNKVDKNASQTLETQSSHANDIKNVSSKPNPDKVKKKKKKKTTDLAQVKGEIVKSNDEVNKNAAKINKAKSSDGTSTKKVSPKQNKDKIKKKKKKSVICDLTSEKDLNRVTGSEPTITPESTNSNKIENASSKKKLDKIKKKKRDDDSASLNLAPAISEQETAESLEKSTQSPTKLNNHEDCSDQPNITGRASNTTDVEIEEQTDESAKADRMDLAEKSAAKTPQAEVDNIKNENVEESEVLFVMESISPKREEKIRPAKRKLPTELKTHNDHVSSASQQKKSKKKSLCSKDVNAFEESKSVVTKNEFQGNVLEVRPSTETKKRKVKPDAGKALTDVKKKRKVLDDLQVNQLSVAFKQNDENKLSGIKTKKIKTPKQIKKNVSNVNPEDGDTPLPMQEASQQELLNTGEEGAFVKETPSAAKPEDKTAGILNKKTPKNLTDQKLKSKKMSPQKKLSPKALRRKLLLELQQSVSEKEENEPTSKSPSVSEIQSGYQHTNFVKYDKDENFSQTQQDVETEAMSLKKQAQTPKRKSNDLSAPKSAKRKSVFKSEKVLSESSKKTPVNKLTKSSKKVSSKSEKALPKSRKETPLQSSKKDKLKALEKSQSVVLEAENNTETLAQTLTNLPQKSSPTNSQDLSAKQDKLSCVNETAGTFDDENTETCEISDKSFAEACSSPMLRVRSQTKRSNEKVSSNLPDTSKVLDLNADVSLPRAESFTSPSFSTPHKSPAKEQSEKSCMKSEKSSKKSLKKPKRSSKPNVTSPHISLNNSSAAKIIDGSDVLDEIVVPSSDVELDSVVGILNLSPDNMTKNAEKRFEEQTSETIIDTAASPEIAIICSRKSSLTVDSSVGDLLQESDAASSLQNVMFVNKPFESSNAFKQACPVASDSVATNEVVTSKKSPCRKSIIDQVVDSKSPQVSPLKSPNSKKSRKKLAANTQKDENAFDTVLSASSNDESCANSSVKESDDTLTHSNIAVDASYREVLQDLDNEFDISFNKSASISDVFYGFDASSLQNDKDTILTALQETLERQQKTGAKIAKEMNDSESSITDIFEGFNESSSQNDKDASLNVAQESRAKQHKVVENAKEIDEIVIISNSENVAAKMPSKTQIEKSKNEGQQKDTIPEINKNNLKTRTVLVENDDIASSPSVYLTPLESLPEAVSKNIEDEENAGIDTVSVRNHITPPASPKPAQTRSIRSLKRKTPPAKQDENVILGDKIVKVLIDKDSNFDFSEMVDSSASECSQDALARPKRRSLRKSSSRVRAGQVNASDTETAEQLPPISEENVLESTRRSTRLRRVNEVKQNRMRSDSESSVNSTSSYNLRRSKRSSQTSQKNCQTDSDSCAESTVSHGYSTRSRR